MSRVSITRSLLDDLAMSISAKSGEPVPMTLDEMKDAVDGIQTGGGTLITKSITANGTYTARDDNADGYSSVTVNVPSPVPTLETVTKIYTPTETAQTETITASSGFDGLSQVSVSVGAISSDYVGSGITRRSSSDLTASGATVTVPSGYYSAEASKAIGTGSITAPTITVDSATGEINASTRCNSGGYIALNTTRSSSEQLDVQAATTITPSTSAQVAVASGKYTTGDVVIEAMPSGTAGTPTATKGTVSNHSVTVTPSVTNTTGYITGGTKNGTAVTVSASELVSGSQTITDNGTTDVTNLASVTVAIPFVTYYTGTSDPSSSLGNDGDIYLKVVS